MSDATDAAAPLLETPGTFTLLFEPLKQHLGGRRFHSNEEV